MEKKKPHIFKNKIIIHDQDWHKDIHMNENYYDYDVPYKIKLIPFLETSREKRSNTKKYLLNKLFGYTAP